MSQSISQNHFDVIVIGGGPGGYVAAIKAAQSGLKTACIEKRETLGGTCLNVGCIPSKALLNSSHKFEDAKHNFKKHGIEVGSLKLNLAKMMENKDQIVKSLTQGIEFLFNKNKVTYFKGHGSFISNNEINVETDKGSEKIRSKNFIIATGSEVIQIPGIKIDEERIVSSTGALELKKVPEKMIVIGGGYIGLEMSSIWSRLGSEVTVIEYSDKIVSAMDSDISKEFQKLLSKQGIKFKFSTKVVSVAHAKSGVEVVLEQNPGGQQEKLEVDVALIAVGRKAHTNGLGLDKIGIKTDEHGKVPVNDKFETSVKGIYAIGDVITGPMLAHKAEEEGVACVEIITGQHGHVNYDAIPGIVYTNPEVASVGKTEEELKKSYIEYNVGKFPFMANSRAKSNGETDGFVKILACKKTDRILGAHIIGTNAGDLIQEVVLGMEFKAASEDIARTSHGHPGLSEAVKEAAMAAFSKPIHM
jgi:dihydrolipoamide dehydrogenase